MTKEFQHYIPKCYLRGFTIENEKSLIWEYDKHNGTISRDPKSIGKICGKKFYYAQTNKNGEMDTDSIENAHWFIENRFPKVIRKIIPIIKDKYTIIKLANDDMQVIALFISLLYTRVPNFRDSVSDIAKDIIKNIGDLLYKNKFKHTLPDELKPLVEGKKFNELFQIHLNDEWSLKPMINAAYMGSLVLLEQKFWSFFMPAEGMSFITSDNPLFFDVDDPISKRTGLGYAPFSPLSHAIVPLRKNLAVKFKPKELIKQPNKDDGFLVIKLDKFKTRIFNKCIAYAANDYIYSCERSDGILKMIQKIRDSRQKMSIRSL